MRPLRREASSDSNKHLIEHLVGHSAHEAVERCVVGRALEAKCSSQVAVLGEADFGLAKRPVLEAYQAEDGHQLWLHEDVLGVLAGVSGQDFLHDLMRSLCKEH